MYQEIYIKEHGCEKVCKKYTVGGKHDCERCVAEYKSKHDLPPIPCPSHPLYSDHVTRVLSFADLFAVHAADKEELFERSRAVQMEKEHQERIAKDKDTAEADMLFGKETQSEVMSDTTADKQDEPVEETTTKEAVSLDKQEPQTIGDGRDTHITENPTGVSPSQDNDADEEPTVDENFADEGTRSESEESPIITGQADSQEEAEAINEEYNSNVALDNTVKVDVSTNASNNSANYSP